MLTVFSAFGLWFDNWFALNFICCPSESWLGIRRPSSCPKQALVYIAMQANSPLQNIYLFFFMTYQMMLYTFTLFCRLSSSNRMPRRPLNCVGATSVKPGACLSDNEPVGWLVGWSPWSSSGMKDCVQVPRASGGHWWCPVPSVVPDTGVSDVYLLQRDPQRLIRKSHSSEARDFQTKNKKEARRKQDKGDGYGGSKFWVYPFLFFVFIFLLFWRGVGWKW